MVKWRTENKPSSVYCAGRVIFGIFRLHPDVADKTVDSAAVIYNMADDIDAFNPFEDENGDDPPTEEAVLPDVS